MNWGDADVRERISVADAVAAMRAVCGEIAAGAFELPARTVLADGGYLVMPVLHRPTGTGLTKVVSVTAGAAAPTVDGQLVWTDRDGRTTALAGAAALTALRTAALSAVAADLLAPAEARTLTVFGSGPQARAHVQAFATVRPLEKALVVGRDPVRARAACDDLAQALPGLSIRPCDDPRQALRAAELVCCATTAAVPLFDCDWLAGDVHVTAVGSHRAGVRELPRELLAVARLLVVDDTAACLSEAGEVIDALERGLVTRSDVVDLPRLLLQPTTVSEGRTIFKSVGTAAFDWALAALLAGAVAPVSAT